MGDHGPTVCAVYDIMTVGDNCPDVCGVYDRHYDCRH